MSLIKSRLRAHERGFARALMHERRSPQAGVSASETFGATSAATSATASPSVVYKLPHSMKALIGIIVVLSLIVIGTSFIREHGAWHMDLRPLL